MYALFTEPHTDILPGDTTTSFKSHVFACILTLDGANLNTLMTSTPTELTETKHVSRKPGRIWKHQRDDEGWKSQIRNKINANKTCGSL